MSDEDEEEVVTAEERAKARKAIDNFIKKSDSVTKPASAALFRRMMAERFDAEVVESVIGPAFGEDNINER
jgi:hypothetical protein